MDWLNSWWDAEGPTLFQAQSLYQRPFHARDKFHFIRYILENRMVMDSDRVSTQTNWGRTFVPTNFIQTANQISSRPTSGANEAYVSFTYSTGQHPHFGLQEISRQLNVNDFGAHLTRLFSVCHLQGNKAFAGEAGIRPLSRVPCDSGSGGQLVPPQTFAYQKWPGANECEHTAASYPHRHQIESFLWDIIRDVYSLKMLIYAQFSYSCIGCLFWLQLWWWTYFLIFFFFFAGPFATCQNEWGSKTAEFLFTGCLLFILNCVYSCITMESYILAGLSRVLSHHQYSFSGSLH